VVSSNQHLAVVTADYFTSLCGVCFRHLRQNFLNSNRSVVVFRFFVVE
jgi:hypothetical protein